jgi:hypothetical protein
MDNVVILDAIFRERVVIFELLSRISYQTLTSEINSLPVPKDDSK